MTDTERLDWLESLGRREPNLEATMEWWVGGHGRILVDLDGSPILHEGATLREAIDAAKAHAEGDAPK